MPELQAVDEGFETTLSNNGKETTFTLKGAGVGLPQIVMFAVLGLLPAVGLGPGILIFMIPIYAVFAYAIWYRSRSQSFTVGSEAITKKGKSYAIKDISEVMIANDAQESLASAKPSVSGGLIIVGGGATAAAMAAGSIMGSAAHNRVTGAGRVAKRDAAKKGFSIKIRHGRKRIRLVDSLDEDTAISVFNKIIRITEQ